MLDLLRVGSGLIDLVDRDDDRYLGGLSVAHGFAGLRHDAVIGRDDQDDDVGDVGAARAHDRERFVAGRIDEGDRLVVFYLSIATLRVDGVSADVLGNPARFAAGHVGFADRVEEGRLAVVDVAHDGHDRRTRLKLLGLVFGDVEERLLLERDVTHFVLVLAGDQGRRVEVDRLVDRSHHAHLHELADDVHRLDAELVGEILDRDRVFHLDVAFVLGRGGDVGLADLLADGELFLLGKENHFLLAVIREAHVLGTDFGHAPAAAAFFRGFFLGHLIEVFLGELDDAETVARRLRRARLGAVDRRDDRARGGLDHRAWRRSGQVDDLEDAAARSHGPRRKDDGSAGRTRGFAGRSGGACGCGGRFARRLLRGFFGALLGFRGSGSLLGFAREGRFFLVFGFRFRLLVLLLLGVVLAGREGVGLGLQLFFGLLSLKLFGRRALVAWHRCAQRLGHAVRFDSAADDRRCARSCGSGSLGGSRSRSLSRGGRFRDGRGFGRGCFGGSRFGRRGFGRVGSCGFGLFASAGGCGLFGCRCRLLLAELRPGAADLVSFQGTHVALHLDVQAVELVDEFQGREPEFLREFVNFYAFSFRHSVSFL